MFATWTEQQLQARDSLCIALSGGSTPQLWFTVLAENYTDKIDWDHLHFFWVDERYVSHDHAESNFGVAKKILFDKIAIPQENLHPVPVTGDINADVLSYSEEIAKYVLMENGWPVFDLITLGMGTDGHTASIFPGQLALFDSEMWVSESINPHTLQQRVTLTGNVINRAKTIHFLVTGKDKAPLLHDIFFEAGIADHYPAAHIRKENTIWLIDTDAKTFA